MGSSIINFRCIVTGRALGAHQHCVPSLHSDFAYGATPRLISVLSSHVALLVLLIFCLFTEYLNYHCSCAGLELRPDERFADSDAEPWCPSSTPAGDEVCARAARLTQAFVIALHK